MLGNQNYENGITDYYFDGLFFIKCLSRMDRSIQAESEYSSVGRAPDCRKL